MLPAHETRCLDNGCPERHECRRWLERWLIPDSGPLLSHAASLFPFDLPLGEPCPHRIAPEDEALEAGDRMR